MRDLGRIGYARGVRSCSSELVEQRKRGRDPRSAAVRRASARHHAGPQRAHGKSARVATKSCERAGIAFHHTDRGGDVTYHGPGQIVGYPILDLREWKRDVVAYVRALEQAIIDALGGFGIAGGRDARRDRRVGRTSAKIAAIGVHISRWVTSHGFALNVDTDLSYFQYIVPCGLTKPVTSMAALGLHGVARRCASGAGARVRRAVSICEMFELQLSRQLVTERTI